MASVTESEPSACIMRTYTLLLLASTTSYGTWAMIWVGETDRIGERMPST